MTLVFETKDIRVAVLAQPVAVKLAVTMTEVLPVAALDQTARAPRLDGARVDISTVSQPTLVVLMTHAARGEWAVAVAQ